MGGVSLTFSFQGRTGVEGDKKDQKGSRDMVTRSFVQIEGHLEIGSGGDRAKRGGRGGGVRK